MKALLYKEFKLAMHPLCYLFIALFPFMILIPNYPTAIGFIYVLTCYPVLFLGANKGQQSNDLLFSTLLPVRKKDIVLARIFTVAFMQLAFILIAGALCPLGIYFQEMIKTGASPEETTKAVADVGLSLHGFISIVGIVLVGFSIADLIYFSVYYKHGKSIVMSTLLTIIGFIVYLGIFTIGIPFIPGCEGYKTFLCDSGIGYQFIVLGGGLLLYVLLHFLTYKVASKELEQVDF